MCSFEMWEYFRSQEPFPSAVPVLRRDLGPIRSFAPLRFAFLRKAPKTPRKEPPKIKDNVQNVPPHLSGRHKTRVFDHK